MKPIMKCGHAANSQDGFKKPICAICIGIKSGADEIEHFAIDLSGRLADCNARCGLQQVSRADLPFFAHRPFMETDEYYCGCRGWD